MDIFSPIHLVIIAGVALLIFGPKRLPELGSGLGKTLKSFREAVNGPAEEIKNSISQSTESSEQK